MACRQDIIFGSQHMGRDNSWASPTMVLHPQRGAQATPTISNSRWQAQSHRQANRQSAHGAWATSVGGIGSARVKANSPAKPRSRAPHVRTPEATADPRPSLLTHPSLVLSFGAQTAPATMHMVGRNEARKCEWVPQLVGYFPTRADPGARSTMETDGSCLASKAPLSFATLGTIQQARSPRG